MGIDTASIQAGFPASFVLLAAVAVTFAILILFTLFTSRHRGAQHGACFPNVGGFVLWAGSTGCIFARTSR